MGTVIFSSLLDFDFWTSVSKELAQTGFSQIHNIGKKQVVHEQKFKDLLSRTCQVSTYIATRGNILLLDFLVLT